jgi:hypothetical protein
MSYYDNTTEYNLIGIDYDLEACLEYNPQDLFNIKDIDKVLAVHMGENDGDDWRWILQLKDNRFVFLQGGCDYTGWDCQSWATSRSGDTAEAVAEYALGDVPIQEDNQPYNAGLGHMINILSGTYNKNFKEVRDELLIQLEMGKNKTWREQTKDDFPDLPKIK